MNKQRMLLSFLIYVVIKNNNEENNHILRENWMINKNK